MGDKFERLKGIFPLMSIPFQEDGRVDYEAFERLVSFVCGSGADGVGLWGMMSEYYKLDDYERGILETIFFRCMNRHNAASLVSVTDWCTEKAVAHAREYEQKGADFLMLLPPFYYNPSKENIYRHITSVVAAVEIPVVVQYAPQSTGMYFEDEVLFSLAEEYPNVAFKLEHNPQREFIQSFLKKKPDLKVMSGYAGLDMPALLETGVRGAMPGCSFAEVHNAIYRNFASGQKETACAIYKKLEEYLQEWMTSVERLIAVEKHILYRRKLLKNDRCRHPGYHLDGSDLDRIETFLQEFSDILSSFAG